MKLLDKLKNGFIMLDGGMGTELQKLGLAAGELPEGQNLKNPDAVTEIQKKYLAAGCSLCGGRAYAMLEKLIREAVELATGEKIPSVYSQLDKLLSEKTESELKADCRFCGTRNDPSVRGGIFNISENNFKFFQKKNVFMY